MLGGIKTPSVPPAAIVPVAIWSEYPLFLISGIPIVPIAAHVAGLDPLRAAKIEQAPIFEITKPPGNLQSHLSKPVYKSFPAGELATAIPIKINIGIESRTKEFKPA